MRRSTVAVATAALALTFLASPGAGAQAAGATVTVIHGIPDTPVDVYVDDALVLDDFGYETITDPLTLAAGDHNVKIRAATSDASDSVVLEGDVTLPAGANASLIAHLSATGEPALTPFVNDTSPTAAGQGRLVVRHTAAAPAVDVLAGGAPVFANVANADQAAADLPAGTVSATVAAAGATAPVIGPADVPVTEGAATIVYAVGSLDADNLGVLVQTISGLHSPPAAVAGGNSGLADSESSGTALPVLLVVAGLALVTGATVATVKVRR